MSDRASLLRLQREIARDLQAAASLVADLSYRQADIRRGQDPVLLGYTAMTLHQLYTALETVFERICRTLEGTLPTGRDSHRALLTDMELELPGIRPPVLRADTVASLGTLLRFRHFVRHAYAVSWDAKRIVEVVDAAITVWPEVDEQLRTFGEYLAEVADALD